MNKLYELATTVFQATTKDGQQLQYNILQDEIHKLLISKNEQELDTAINSSLNSGDRGTAKLIEDMIQTEINTIMIEDHLQNIRSDLFILPILTNNNGHHTALPSLSYIEKQLQTQMEKFRLIAEGLEVILTPIILGNKTSLKMSATKWFDLHQQSIAQGHHRHLRDIFSKPFSLTTNPSEPTLNFIVGTIKQPILEHATITPFFLNKDIKFNYQDFLSSFSNILSEQIKTLNTKNDTSLMVLPPRLMLNSLLDGYRSKQEFIIQKFIDYYQNSDFSLAFVSLDIPNNFVAFIWDQKINQIIDYLTIESLGFSANENIELAISYLDNKKMNVFIGNSFIPYSILDNIERFDFLQYIEEVGVSSIDDEDDEY